MKKHLVRSLALLMALLLAVPPVGVMAEEPEPVSTEISVEETAGESPAAAEPAPEEPVTEEPADSVTEPEPETETEPEEEETSVSLMGEADVELLATTASGTCGTNLTWALENGTLTISGTGAMADYSSYSSVPWYAYTDDIETVVVENGVTSIGRFAFRTCSALTAVQLPSGLVSIGEEAFSFCSSLTEITIPAGVTSIGDLAFAACLDLTEITVASGSSAYCSVDGVLFTKDKTKLLACPMGNVRTAYEIPDGVTTIEDGAFYTCNSLTAVTIPDSVTSIGMAAFFSCSDLSEITFEGNAPTIGSNAFTYVTATCTYPAAASGWTDSVRQNYGGTLTWQATESSSTGEVTLDVTGLESDHPYASSTNKTWELSHPSATSITLTFDTLTELENNWDKLYIYDENGTQVAVYTGTSLAGKTITVDGSSVQLKLTSDSSVQKWGFRVTEAVAKVDGESSEEPDDAAPTVEGTYGTNLTWKLVGGTLIISGTGAMEDLSHPADQPWYDYRSRITSVTVNSGVTTVGQFAFRDLYALRTVSLASTVKEIGLSAFLSAIELTTVSMPGVETIGECAFGGCTGMTSVTLPTSLRVIEDRAFEACSNLSSVTLPSGLTTIGQCAFRSCAIASDTFNIPASVTEIGGGAFAGTQIKNYSVASGNTAYKVEKYTLLTADGSTIVCFAPGQSGYYTISMSKEKILPYAFYGATDLTTVEFQSPYDSYMSEIGERAFEGCTGLTTIKNLPPSLRSIGNRAFYGCTGLTTANYLGTADLWDEFVHVESNNEKLTNRLTYGTVAHVTHPVCGLECTCEDADHKPIRWYKWNGTSNLVQTHYYLTGDVTRESYYEIYGTARICLNDHTIETNGEQPGFWVTSTGKFTITDCGDSGTLSSDDHNSSVGSTAERGIENEGTFTLYNGTVQGGSEGVSNNEGATLNVYGGTIRGGEMSICDWGGTVNLYGGTIDGSVDTTNTTTCLVDGAAFKSTLRNYGTATIQSGTFECEALDSFWPAAIVNYGTMTIEDVDVSFVGDEYGDGIRNSGTLHLKGGSLPAIKRTSSGSTTQYYGLANTGANARAYISGTPDLKAVSVAYPGTLSFAAQDGSAAYTGDGEILFRVDSSTFGSGVAASNVTAAIMNAITQINLTGAPSNMDGDLTLEGTDLMLKSHVASGFCGKNLTWILTKDGTLTISGTGDMYSNSQSWYSYRTAIKKAIIGDGATSIGGYSFENCSNMAEITIPGSVIDIGDSAFYGCKSLTAIDLPSGITDVPLRVFQGCAGLTSIEIPEGVTYIDGSAFQGCTGLSSVTLPKSLTRINSAVFHSCTGLTEITIPKNVTYMGQSLFQGCTALKTVTFTGAAPATIEYNSFTGVTADCYYPASAGGWTGSVRQNYGGTLTWKAVKEENPGGQCGENLTWKLDTETGTLTISGTGAMYDFAAESAPWIAYYEDIQTIVIADGVTTIGSNAFDSLYSLTTVTLPEGITSIGNRAFVHCQSLTEIDLPDSVTAIGNYAFYGCTALTAITFEGSAPTIASDAYTGVTATAYYPYGNATWTEAKRDNYGGSLTWVVSAPETFPGAGSGTEVAPYQVDSPEALDALRYFEDAHFLQTGDIDMTGVDWTPIPTFSGTYDGGNHKITGLTAALTSAEENLVLGGLMDTATGEIKNLHLENVSVTVTNTTAPTNLDGQISVGGIVGKGGTISSCSVSGTVRLSMSILGSTWVGGIAGKADTVTDCINRAAVTVTGATDSGITSGGAAQYIGGVVGYATTVARCANLAPITVGSAGDISRLYLVGGVTGRGTSVTESYNRGTVSLTHGHRAYVGGIMSGYGADSAENCYNAGAIICTFDGQNATRAIGGIVGSRFDNSAKNCYNAGAIRVTGGTDTTVGGVSGGNSATLTDCWYLDTTTATTVDTATALTAAAMGDPASFEGFDFDTVWCYGTDANYRYPVLRAFGDVGHVFLTYTYNNDATCTEDGTETAVCAVCKTETDTRPAPGTALGHTEVADEAKAPTCGATGLTEGSHCGRCGATIVAQEIIPATGEHDWTPATMQAPKTCTVCGATEGEPLNGSFTAGSGTETDPYQIETKLQLDNVRNYRSSHFVLVNDIVFTEEDFAPGGLFYNDGKGWTPISYRGAIIDSFTGSLDGRGHTISGLQSHQTGTTYMVGLFSYLSTNAVVKDLTLSGFDVSLSAASQDGYVGALAGYCSSYGAINNVTVTDSRIQGSTVSGSSVYVGGISGYAGSGSYEGSIGNCTVTDSVTVSGTSTNSQLYVGGIVGQSYRQPIRDCASAATVQAESSSYVVGVGGIAGNVIGTSQTDRCTNSGTITCTAKETAIGRVGGIVGDSRDQVHGCVNSGSVSVNSSSSYTQNVGGIVGNGDGNFSIMACVNKGTVTSNAKDGYTGGIAGWRVPNGTGIYDCRNEGDISAAFNAAGIAGFLNNGYIGDCRNTGRVYSSGGNAAGIVLFFSDGGGQLSGCANFGEVVADSGNAAGIVEKLYRPLYNCYNAGDVKQTDGNYAAAGIAVNLHSTLNLCYNAGMVTRGSNPGAAITPNSATQNGWYFLDNLPSAFSNSVNTAGQRTHEQMQQASTFAGYNFSTVWDFEPLSGYLYPQLRYEMPALTGVELVNPPQTPIRWVSGEALDLTGLQGVATFDDGSTNVFDLTADLFPALDPTVSGVQTVPISYKGLTSEKTLSVEVRVHEYTDTVTPPTCKEQGYTTHSCSCGDSYVDSYVDPLGHDYGENGLCIRCGTAEPVPTGTCGTVTWVLRDDVLILTPTDGAEGTMTAYASAAKYPWSDYADDISEIEVGEGVLNVSSFAFADMRRLESVFLSETVEKIGEGAFADSGRGLEITICNPDCQISDGDDGETLSGDAWIFGYTDSTAEEFAEEYGYDFCGTSNRNSTPGHKTETTLEEATCVEGEHTLTICVNGCGYEKKGKYRTDPSGIHVFDDKNLCTVCGFHGTQSEDGTVTPILSGQCGESLYWALSDDKTTLTLTGTGAMWSYEKATYLAAEDDDVEEQDGSTAPWNYYAGEIGTLVLPEGMTTVGSYGFAWLSNLETLTLPGTLTGIGIAAFRGCSSITGTLVIPDKVIHIGQSAFQGCRSFTGLELGEGLVTIFDSAFSDFGPRKEEPIEDLTIPASVEHINADAFADAAFSGTLTILGPVEELAEGAFGGCHFDEVVLSEGTTILREGALSFGDVEGEDLTALTIHLPLSLQRIDRWAIDGYESGEALTLNYAGCEPLWDALVDSGDIDDRMTARGVNVVTADHSFTDYVPDTNGTTETAACDFGCGETDTRDIPVAPDPIDDVQAMYVADNRLVLLQNVPGGATVILAAYEDGQLVYTDWKADASATTSFVLPEELQDAELRIFFLNGSGSPMGKFIPLSI